MRVIELLIRIHEPRCVSVEVSPRGKAIIDREQILAALANAEEQHTLGYHLLMVKHLQDKQSRDFINRFVLAWADRHQLSDQAKQALGYVVDMITDVPLPAQQKRLASLRHRYMRSHFAYLKPLEQANKQAQLANIEPNSKDARQLRILKLDQSRKSTLCPRCRGTGEIGRTQKRPCPECDGKGRLVATIGALIKSLNVAESVFRQELNAAVTQFEQHCYTEMSNAEQVIKERLRSEID